MPQEGRRSRNILASRALMIVAVAIAAATFVLDTITELDFAVAVLYVAVILIAVRILPPRGVLVVALGCIGLTLTSAYLSLGDPLHSAGVFNCFISIAAIAATTYLGLQNQSAAMALQDARTELAQLNRVATLGELTATIAHEVNQPIAGAANNAEAARRWLSAQPPDLREVHEALDAVIEDAKRAGEIVAGLRALAGRAEPSRDNIDLNATILEVIGLIRSEIQNNRIALNMVLANNLAPVLGDRIQLQQVVLNLTLNAVEAMSRTDSSPRELRIVTEWHDRSSIVVTVRDRGPGLDPAILDRMFLPFYTTKPGGIGVGLSICRSIVEDHGGRIWASAAPEGGAMFQFTLPVARP